LVTVGGTGFLLALLITIVPVALSGYALLTGRELVLVFALVAIVVLFFLAFVFERLLRFQARHRRGRIDIEAGKKAD